MNKEEFDKLNVFGLGQPNIAYSKYFIGNSYLNPLARIEENGLFFANKEFPPHLCKKKGWLANICLI